AGEEEIYRCSELQQVVNVFRDENACPDGIDEAGKVLIALYGRKKSEETRDSLRFKLFQKSLVKNNFHLAFLLPTSAAAREHSLRAYLQKSDIKCSTMCYQGQGCENSLENSIVTNLAKQEAEIDIRMEEIILEVDLEEEYQKLQVEESDSKQTDINDYD
ncbi:hypothetical protein AVEN_178607-1, partial [Araneus ventricosus]